MNINEMLDSVDKEMGINQGSGDWFKLAEGDNRVRVLDTLEPYASHFKAGACLGKADCDVCKSDPEAKASVKFLCHVVDRKDGAIKLAQLPYSVARAIGDYQSDPDYSFSGVPMPYDINIKAKGAGTKEVEYSVIASPKREEVAKEIMDKLATKNTPIQIKERMQDKKRKELGLPEKVQTVHGTVEYPKNDISVDEIPF
jgi:hypothetical protein